MNDEHGKRPLGTRSQRRGREHLLDPGSGALSDWTNRYKFTLFPIRAEIVASRELPANPLRCYLIVQNKSAGVIFVNFGQNPTEFASIEIAAGGNYIFEGGGQGGAFCPPDDVYILGSAAALDGAIGEGLWQSVAI